MSFPSIRDPAGHSRPAVILAFASALLVVALDASAQIDLTGRWRVEDGTPDVFADIVQSGTSVSVAWTQELGGAGPIPLNLTGTFDQTTLVATEGSSWSITMQVYGPGDVLDGTFAALFNPLAGYGHIYFTRCECYDGNEIDGDGCSSLCRVEPCFSCTAEPSVCTPSPDTAACDDGNDCTTGETCSAGVCGAGSSVSPCVNLDGLWHVSLQSDFGEGEVDRRYRQRNGVVTEFDVSQELGAFPSSVGTVDTETGAMSLISRGGRVFCTASSTFAGTASLDNLTFSGTGVSIADRPGGCIGFTVNEQGARFPSPSVPSLSSSGRIAVALALALLALGFLWRTRNAARPSA